MSKSVNKYRRMKNFAKLVHENAGLIDGALTVAGFASGIFCVIMNASDAEVGAFPCIAAAESGIFSLKSVVNGFVVYDKINSECYGDVNCKNGLLKEYAVDRIKDLGLTGLSIATLSMGGDLVRTGKVAKAAKSVKATKTAKVANKAKITDPAKYKRFYSNEKIKKSRLKKMYKDVADKPKILDVDESMSLRDLVKLHTGKNFREGFDEFFIRLKDKDLAARLIQKNENLIKNGGIRRGGEHEMLMAKNFKDFLTNPKWGDDGPMLAFMVNKIVQPVKTVCFKKGLCHGQTYSARYHNQLGKVIDVCSDAGCVFKNIRNLGKQELTHESFFEMDVILRSTLSVR